MIQVKPHFYILTGMTFPDIVIHRAQTFFQLLTFREVFIFGFIVKLKQGVLALFTFSRIVPVNTFARQMIEKVKKEWKRKQQSHEEPIPLLFADEFNDLIMVILFQKTVDDRSPTP